MCYELQTNMGIKRTDGSLIELERYLSSLLEARVSDLGEVKA